METRNYEDLINDMKNCAIARQSKITDFNEGSNIMTIFEAVANVVEEAYIDTRNGFTNNLKQIAFSIFDFQKKVGQKASVTVIFSRSIKGSKLTIPSNIIVSDGTHEFITTAMTTIQADELDSLPVSAIASEIGEDYNIAANSINTIVSTVSGEIVAVTNNVRATGGADEETETEALARFKTKINGLQGTNKYGLKSGILAYKENGNSVRSVGIVEHFPPETDGTDQAYNMTVYVDDGTGAMTESLRNGLSDLINGDGSADKPGLRATGLNVRILPANQIAINISVSCKIYRTETSLAKTEITESLTNFINNLTIGENVILSDLVMNLRQIAYVTDVQDLKIGTSQILGIENIPIDENQIARMGTLNLTFIP